MWIRLLPRTVVVLGLVSLLNDAASEMITPLLPIFLTATLGAGPAVVGLVEGLAESTASILKLVSGRLADRGINPKILVMSGYGTSNLARPLIGAALGWTAVLGLRFLDRVGKGIRTAPRDALIAGATDRSRRGAAFGFHRSMDHAGAVIGPLCAYAILARQVSIGDMFFWSAIPGVLVMLLLLFGLQRRAPIELANNPPRLRWSVLDVRLRAMIVAAGALALAAVPEAFAVLWARDAGLAIVWVPLIWAFASLAKMLIALPAGMISDRVGRLPVWLIGICGRVVALMALGFVNAHGVVIWLVFLSYALSLAISEPVESSIIGDHAPPNQRGTAFGLYHLAGGLLALPGAVLFGMIWQFFSATTAFASAAAVTALAAAPMVMLARHTNRD